MKGLPGFLTRNWFLKLSAFGVALLLWFAVQVETQSSRQDYSVPVQIDLGDPQWAILEDPAPTSVTVRFAGPFREIVRLGTDRPNLVIPMSQVTTGDTVVILRPQWVRVQDRPGMTVEDIQPPTVRLQLEPIVRHDLPIAVRLEGELPERWARSGPPRVVPDEVRVSGPESRVLALDSVRLATVDLSGIREAAPLQVQVDTSASRRLQVIPNRVELDLRLEARGERRFEALEIQLGIDGWEELWEVDVEQAALRLSGALSLIEGLEEAALRLTLDLDADDLPAEPGETATFALVLEGVPDFVSAELEPGEVTVRRREEPGLE